MLDLIQQSISIALLKLILLVIQFRINVHCVAFVAHAHPYIETLKVASFSLVVSEN